MRSHEKKQRSGGWARRLSMQRSPACARPCESLCRRAKALSQENPSVFFLSEKVEQGSWGPTRKGEKLQNTLKRQADTGYANTSQSWGDVWI